MKREKRFPTVDWYCDHCGAYLNDQKGFDDHKYVWKCKECGFKNSISWDSIIPDDSIAVKILLHFVGVISYVSFWTVTMLGMAMFIFHADQTRYMPVFLIMAGILVLSFVFDMIIEFGLRHRPFSWIVLMKMLIRNLKEDLVAPFRAVKELISNLLSLITRILPLKRKYAYKSNVTILIFSLFYVCVFVAEIIWFNKITGLNLQNWFDAYRAFFDTITGFFK